MEKAQVEAHHPSKRAISLTRTMLDIDDSLVIITCRCCEMCHPANDLILFDHCVSIEIWVDFGWSTRWEMIRLFSKSILNAVKVIICIKTIEQEPAGVITRSKRSNQSHLAFVGAYGEYVGKLTISIIPAELHGASSIVVGTVLVQSGVLRPASILVVTSLDIVDVIKTLSEEFKLNYVTHARLFTTVRKNSRFYRSSSPPILVVFTAD